MTCLLFVLQNWLKNFTSHSFILWFLTCFKPKFFFIVFVIIILLYLKNLLSLEKNFLRTESSVFSWCSIFLNSWLRKMENQCYHQKSGNSLCFTWVSEVDIFFLNFPRFSWSAKVCHFTFFIFYFFCFIIIHPKIIFQSIELFLYPSFHWLPVLLVLISFFF